MKVTITSEKGLVQDSAGSGFEVDQMPTSAVKAKTDSFTASVPGVYTITAGAAVTGTLPAASSVPGGIFTFRNGDANANCLTGSAADAGASVFRFVTVAPTLGGKFNLPASTGASVSLISNGLHYTVMAGSGTLSGT